MKTGWTGSTFHFFGRPVLFILQIIIVFNQRKSLQWEGDWLIDLRKMGDSESFVGKNWNGLKDFWSDRLSFFENYTRFTKRDAPLPSWSSSDVEEFIASDPVHGPTVISFYLSLALCVGIYRYCWSIIYDSAGTRFYSAVIGLFFSSSFDFPLESFCYFLI